MKKVFISVLAFGPMLAFAQSPDFSYITSILNEVKTIIGYLLPIVVGLALLGFFWGLAQYIFAAGNDDKMKEGKKHMIWGIIGLFVMVSVWGLVGFLGNLTGVRTTGGTANVPTVNNIQVR